MRTVLVSVACFGLAGGLVFAETKEEKEAAAVAKYDHLEPEWRDKCVAEWRRLYKKTRNSKLLKNDPPYYKPIVVGQNLLEADSWGALEPCLSANKDGITVREIRSKSRVLCTRYGSRPFFIDGVDTKKMITDMEYHFPGLYYVSDTDDYIKKGEKETVFVLKKVPSKNEAKK